ncbi:MAG: SMC family ATPase [Nitrososphaeria archaeon]|nr:SMC family ATPase [Nitrososphaeria archaeon]
MKLEKIFAENLKTFPKLELYLEDYNLTLITGPNGAGKTTAFVTIPVLAFYNEFNGRSLKDYSLENKVAKIGIEFEHEGKRYIILRQYSDGSTKSIFTDTIERKKISKYREIQREIERLFGMDVRTFLNTVVIAQGEVETLSERKPRERRELFLNFLGIDFKKAYEKAGDEIKSIESRIQQIGIEKITLEKDVKEKPNIEKRIPEMEEEIKKLELMLKEKEIEKSGLVTKRESLQKALDGLQGSLAKLQLLKEQKEKLDKEIREFERTAGGLKKDDIVRQIHDIDAKLQKVGAMLDLLDKRNTREVYIRNLIEIVKILDEYRKPEDIKKDEESLKIKVSEIEKGIEDCKKIRMELETKNSASKLYIKDLQESVKCPLCKTELNEERRIELIKEIEDEIKEYPEIVEKINSKALELSKEAELLKKKIDEIIKEYGRSSEAYKRFESLIKGVPQEYVNDPKGSLNKLKLELDEIKGLLEKNAMEIKVDLTSISVQKLVQIQNRANKEREELNKALSLYEKYEENILTQKGLKDEIESLLPLEKEKNNLETKIHEIALLIEEKEREIRNLYESKGKRESELGQLKTKLKEIEEKEKQLKKKQEDEKELLKRKEIFTIIKEQVFKNDAFPTVFLDEFVKHVQMNLSDFISRFKGGRYEIDISLTSEGDVEVRARDRSKLDSTFRSIKDFSQGERTILGFAIRLATMKAISSYKGKSMPNILIVDEGFGPLDQENMKALIDGIKELKNVFEQIFIITHIEQVKEEFEQRLIVEETPKGSIIKKV